MMEAASDDTSSESMEVESNHQHMEKASENLRKELKMAFNLLKGVEADRLKILPTASILERINEIVQEAWEAPDRSSDLGAVSCEFLQSDGVIDFVLNNIHIEDIQLPCAKLLKSALLTEENREYVVNNGLKQAVTLAASVSKKCLQMEPECCRAATGIIECLFDSSETVCSEIVDMGGFDTILFGCRINDKYVMQHCARAIANLSIYGNAGIYAVMKKKLVTLWLFPLAFYSDDVVKYYAHVAVSALYANGFQAAEVREQFMELVGKFVASHSRSGFAHSNRLISTGHRGPWLKGLIPLLSSRRQEIRRLASFHFCMEASIKRSRGKETVFSDIGAIQPLKILAVNQDPIASDFAAQALLILGETTERTDELSSPDGVQVADS